MALSITFCRFRRNKNFEAIGDPVFVTFTGSATEITKQARELTYNTDVTKWSSLTFVRAEETEES